MDLLAQLQAIVDPSFEEHRTLFSERDGSEHELRWSRMKAVWTVGGVQRRKWSYNNETISAACFACFEVENAPQDHSVSNQGLASSSRRTRSPATFGPFTLLHESGAASANTVPREHKRSICVCIFMRDVAHIYALNGLQHTINVPFAVRQVWQIYPQGVLLQALTSLPPTPFEHGPQTPAVPSLYSLSTPFDEPRPVSLEDSTDCMNGTIAWHTTISHVSKDLCSPLAPPLLVSVDSQRKELKVFTYQLRIARRHRTPILVNGNLSCVKGSVHPVAPLNKEALQSAAQDAAVTTAESAIQKANESLRPPSFMDVDGRPRSQSRSDLSVTLDRMDIGGASTDVLSPSQLSIRPQSTQTQSGAIRSELFLKPIWKQAVTEMDCQQPCVPFSTFDSRLGQSKLALIVGKPNHKAHILQMKHLEVPTVVQTEDIYAADNICEVEATRSGDGVKDLLCLRSDGSLFLVVPGGTLEVEIMRTVNGVSSKHSQFSHTSHSLLLREDDTIPSLGGPSLIPVHMSRATASSLDLEYSDGTSIRLSTELAPQSGLVRSAFIAISNLCSTKFCFDIRRLYLREWSRMRKCGSDEEDFDCFVSAVLSVVLGKSQPPSNPKQSLNNWSKLAGHAVHHQILYDPVFNFLELPSTHAPSWIDSERHNETPAILHALHLLGEEIKVDGFRRHQLPILVPLLVQLGSFVGADWVEYWLRVCPDTMTDWNLSQSIHLTAQLTPPDLGGFLHTSLGVLTSSQSYVGFDLAQEVYSALPSYEYGALQPLPVTQGLLAIFAALKDGPDLGPTSTRERAQKVVLKIEESGFTLNSIDRLPLSISSPLLEALRTCQNAPPSGWSASTYLLLGRNDLAKMVIGDTNEVFNNSEDHNKTTTSRHSTALESIDTVSEASRVLAGIRAGSAVESDPSGVNFSLVRFADDQRLAEVETIMDSSRVPNVKITERPDLSEHDLAKELAATVNHIIERTFSQPFGRAIVSFGSILRLTQDEYWVPPIEMQVKFVPHNVTYPPDMNKIQPEAKQWADFHNGVAASLRLNPHASGVDSSWIAFNKPNELTAEHAGCLFGLGLTGHLKTMWSWHGYRYLVPKHEPTSIAILLGLGAAHVGTADAEITRLLTVHMRPLLPPDAAELGIPLGAQSAALMGLGLLYLGTGDRTMAEAALQELSVAHLSGGPEVGNEHREAYTITAGLAYGLIMCGLGSTSDSPSDETHLNRLRGFVAGKEQPLPTSILTSSTAPPEVNLNIISPAATIALALMFLKTNRVDIASSFALPPDPAGLKDVQPNLLLLRALGRSLIMWDDITPSVAWVLNQAQRAPKDLTKKQINEGVKELYEFAFFNILSGACLAIGLKYAGTATTAANHVLIHFHDKLLENLRRQPAGQTFDVQLRRAAIREAINVVDLALGLVMAGTGDVSCMQRLRIRHGLFGPHIRYGAHMTTHMALGFLFLGGGRYTLGTSNAAIGCLVAALFPRFPLHSNDSRGLLQAFRHLWVLSVEPRCLIARDADTNEITRIPIRIKISEGQGEPVRTHHFVCPTLLPDFDRFVSLKIDTPRYWPLVINVADDARARLNLLRTQTIYVKRRTGYLSYTDDVSGLQSIAVWNGAPVGDPSALDYPTRKATFAAKCFPDIRNFSRSSTNDGHLLAFADRLCRFSGRTHEESVVLSYTQQAFLEAISGDKPQILPGLLYLFRVRVLHPEHQPMAGWSVRDVHLANEFYSMLFRFHGGLVDATQRQPLMRVAALQGAVSMFAIAAEQIRKDPTLAVAFHNYAHYSDVRSSAIVKPGESSLNVTRKLAFLLLHERVPSGQTLAALRRLSRSTVEGPDGILITKAEWNTIRVGLSLIVQKTALSLSGPRTIPWSLRSVSDFLEHWFHQK